MKIVGYTDRPSIRAGETLSFMVSCEHPSFRADLVRLIHGDENPAGPGFKERVVQSAINREFPGRRQIICGGSYIEVPDHALLRPAAGFSLVCWVLATTPGQGRQALLGRWSEDVAAGFGLFIGDGGEIELCIGDGAGTKLVLNSGEALESDRWYFVAVSLDETGHATLVQRPVDPWPVGARNAVAEATTELRPVHPRGLPFLIAAHSTTSAGRFTTAGNFNGKIDNPRLYARGLSQDELDGLAAGKADPQVASALVGNWDFSKDIGSHKVSDCGPHGLHGRTMNMPTRGMMGHNWSGKEMTFRLAPEQYGAIHFHTDDVEDVGWEKDFSLTVPADLPSGVYAARLRAGDDEDHIPFFVRPPVNGRKARIALLMPTMSYLIYSNFRDIGSNTWDLSGLPNADPSLHPEHYRYIDDNKLFGPYNRHEDGSGVCYASWLRPIVNMRPKFRFRVWAAPARFPADLYMVDWLDQKGLEADVITDHDLHHEGAGALSGYRAVITGSHHEYWTTPMLDAMQCYLQSGGRLMYLGGNGFFGVTSLDPERPHIAETRRWGTNWPFEMHPAERYHSTTGEQGGHWRNRGRAPQRLVGVGTSSAGYDNGSPYIRQPGSFDPRAAFIFQGIGAGELIGDIPSLVVRHGAAGYEQDRLDFGLGTPHHALLLASSINHSHHYRAMYDEMLAAPGGIDGVRPHSPTVPGVVHPYVRSDIVYFEYPRGGAAFSAGAICWRSCLSYNDYENTVSRITENVLRQFIAEPSQS